MLAERTAMFTGVPREVEAILEFGRCILERQVGRKPLTEFHHCPYIGLVGRHKRRAGCLLHPLGEGNNGIDLRGLSDYGGMACKMYFCPAYTELEHGIKEMLRRGAPRWYEYGILVTEVELLNELFRHVRQCRREAMPADAWSGDDRPERIFKTISVLKARWPYVSKFEPPVCHYFFRDGLYHRAQVIYPAARGPSPYHVIFQELCSCFQTTEDLRQAEKRISDTLRALAAILAGR
jgi:hypothetical protein